MHPLLVRQLRRAGLNVTAAAETVDADPNLAKLLAAVSRTYEEADQDRYTIERSLAVVSSEMKELYEDLQKRTDAIHRATLESLSAGVIIVDATGEHLISFNQRFLQMWQIPAELAAARNFAAMRAVASKLLPDAEAYRTRSAALAHDALARGSDVVATIDGRSIQRTTAPVIDRSGSVVGRVWFHEDITERLQREVDLRAARDAAENASRAKSAFFTNMTHELRTPLNAILGFARVLERSTMSASTPSMSTPSMSTPSMSTPSMSTPSLSEQEVAAETREFLGHIVHAGEHMLELVNDLLDMRAVEAGADALEAHPISLPGAVDEAVSLVRPLLTERRHALTIDVKSTLPRALADRRALVQILVNLLSNAAKYTPDGGNISVEAAHNSDGKLRMAVTDDGIGITAAGRDLLFNYHTQLNAKTDHGMKGSGIGLALTRALVNKLGGDIEVITEPGVGSTFQFTLASTT